MDNNIDKCNKKIFDIFIKSPEKLKKIDKNNSILLICSMYYDEIKEQLDKMGFIENINYYCMFNNESDFNGEKWKQYGFTVGKCTYGYEQFFYKGVNLTSIGSFTSIAPNVTIASFNHPLDFISTHPFFYLANRGFIKEDRLDIMKTKNNRNIEIGNDVWIGASVTILPGVKIGNGAVIGAGALVNRDIPDYAVVVGVPVKVIRYRFLKDEIEMINKSQWWNWSDEKIIEKIDLFTNNEMFFNYLRDSND